MSEETDEWHVDLNGAEDGVVVQLNRMGDTGIEVFTTAMPRDVAIMFAVTVLNAAMDICICGEHRREGE